MDTITKREIEYLLFLNASEEEFLKNVSSEISNWDCDKSVVVEMLRDLVQNEFLGLGRLNYKEFVDLKKKEALKTITSWEIMQSSLLILYLTDRGWKRWESNYDWEITLERKKQLVFSGNRYSAGKD